MALLPLPRFSVHIYHNWLYTAEVFGPIQEWDDKRFCAINPEDSLIIDCRGFSRSFLEYLVGLCLNSPLYFMDSLLHGGLLLCVLIGDIFKTDKDYTNWIN